MAEGTIEGTDLATKVVTLRHPVARGSATASPGCSRASRSIQKRILAQASETAVGYRTSPIVDEQRRRRWRARPSGSASARDRRCRLGRASAARPPGRPAPDVAIDDEVHALRPDPPHAQHAASLRRRRADARGLREPRRDRAARARAAGTRTSPCRSSCRAARPRRAGGQGGRAAQSERRPAPALRRGQRVPLPDPPGRLRRLPEPARDVEGARGAPEPDLR